MGNIRKHSSAQIRPPGQSTIGGILRMLPASWVPYAQLMRIDKPGGYYAFVFPYWIGLAYAACTRLEAPSISLLLARAVVLSISCIFLRGAACTWNDNIDQDFDRQVARCKNRPIARGAVSTTAAHLFTLAQTLLGGIAFRFLPWSCLLDAIPITVLFAIYPFGKRFTDYPQVILGFPFAFAIAMSCDSIDVSPFSLRLLIPSISLILANVLWTMIYDTIYAHQDRDDDIKAGVKSMAVRFRESTKTLCSFLAFFMVSLLFLTGYMAIFDFWYYLLACGGVAGSVGLMIHSVDLSVPASCAWWFKWGFWYVGGCLLGGLMLEFGGRV